MGRQRAYSFRYTFIYIIITRANSIIIRIDDITFQDEDLKGYIKGEAYALRGWAYYVLGTMFGGVPLIVDAEYSVEETLQIARSTQEETFDQAESDYKNAYELLPTEWDAENVGRVTKYGIECLEASMMMRWKFWAM